ncbi:MAG: restriction endonuclease subunit S [Gemmatimonadetes bacterium]|nr:restriction endonuclease subunit S [Gemmatimonadota bacterium]
MNVATLGAVCDVVMGQAPPGESYNSSGDGFPLLAGAGDFGTLEPQPKRFTTQPSRMSEVGDILLCVRATVGERNWSDRRYCLGRGVAALRVHTARLDKGYLWHWLASVRSTLEGRARGSTFKQVTREAVESLPLALPPLAEQQRIAAVLGKADAVRRKRRESLGLLDDFLRSEFLEMFGDPVKNEREWGTDLLGNLCSRVTVGFVGPLTDKYQSTGVSMLRSLNVRRGRIQLDELMFVSPEFHASISKSRLLPNDVVSVRTGAPGVTAVIPESLKEANCADLIVMTCGTRIEPQYLCEVLNTRLGDADSIAGSTGAVQTHFNIGSAREVRIPVPPLRLQKRFSDIVRACEKTRSELRGAEESADQLFDSLAQRAFGV